MVDCIQSYLLKSVHFILSVTSMVFFIKLPVFISLLPPVLSKTVLAKLRQTISNVAFSKLKNNTLKPCHAILSATYKARAVFPRLLTLPKT